MSLASDPQTRGDWILVLSDAASRRAEWLEALAHAGWPAVEAALPGFDPAFEVAGELRAAVVHLGGDRREVVRLRALASARPDLPLIVVGAIDPCVGLAAVESAADVVFLPGCDSSSLVKLVNSMVADGRTWSAARRRRARHGPPARSESSSSSYGASGGGPGTELA